MLLSGRPNYHLLPLKTEGMIDAVSCVFYMRGKNDNAIAGAIEHHLVLSLTLTH